MKKILFSIFGLLLSGLIFGQQHTSYTQYTLNQFALNPAVAGLEKCTQTSFGTRRQWSGFEGAPEHVFASFNTRLNKADQFPKNFHGIGAYVSKDLIGFTNYSMLKISYAFHLKMSRNYHFSAGIFAGVHYQKTSFNNLRIRDRSNDPAINSQERSSIIFPEVSPGVFIHNNKFFAGLSMFQQYPTRIKEIGTRENRLAVHYFLMIGYKIEGEVLNYTPSMLVSFAAFAPPTIDLTLTADYKNKISIALGSKYLNSAYTTVQLNIGGGVKIGYSYEYALTELVRVAPSTHEVILQFSSCHVDKNKIKVECPAYQ
tara:strand:+ start:5009 stop:5950 length:942 start_codon:yes stop_codon:yes gene_type:complete